MAHQSLHDSEFAQLVLRKAGCIAAVTLSGTLLLDRGAGSYKARSVLIYAVRWHPPSQFIFELHFSTHLFFSRSLQAGRLNWVPIPVTSAALL